MPQAKAPAKTRMLSTAEAAEYIGAKFTTFQYYYVASRWNIPHYKVGRRIVFKESDLATWLESRRVSS
jgi:excisionase family DNA binding protein